MNPPKRDTGGEILLDVNNLCVAYDGIRAVEEVSFNVRRGEIVTLIGANGAGKTSILRAISGLVAYTGQISFQGKELAKVPSHRIVALGVSHVPEGRAIFGNLSVIENLKLATWQRGDGKEVLRDLKWVFSIFPKLKEREHQLSGTLSGGEQQMLAVGRALMSCGLMSYGRLILLDEPSMGLSPLLVREIFSVIAQINKAGVTILLVEQNANMALRCANRAYVLETGVIKHAGTGEQMLGNPLVRDAYLGGPAL